jgi:intergrase/recombinase
VDNDVRQTEIQRAEPTVPDTCVFEAEMAIEKLKRYKSENIYQISAELIKAGSSIICSDIHKLINSIWNKEELPEQWKESVIVPIYKKDDKTDCSNCSSISLLSTTYKILPNICLSRLTLDAEDVIGKHQCGFRRNRSITNHIFCIRQILKKKWIYSEVVHQLFVDFKKAHDSVRREVLYNNLIEFGIPLKLVRLIKMCLNKNCCKVRVDKHLSASFPVKKGLKK